MKKKVFKPVVQNTLEVITCILVVFLACLDDFELSAIPLIFGLMVVVLINVGLLQMYGKY